MSLDLDTLKKELKTWERQFRSTNGREITKDDVRRNPEIDAKYKLYKNLTNKAKASSNSQPKSTSNPSPSTPRRPPKPTTRNVHPSASIFAKPPPEESVAPVNTSNPFSPVKRKPAAVHPSSHIDSPPSNLPTATTSTIESTSSTPFTDPDNPFAPKPSSTPSTSTIFASPTKSILKPFSPPLIAQGSSRVTSSSNVVYDIADSPKKLQALIASAYTPRTKARKRLRGEEVQLTPSDKRRRVTNLSSSVTKTDERDEDEELGITPVKTSIKGGKAFKPIFDDDLHPVAAPLFFNKLGPQRQGSSSNTSTETGVIDQVASSGFKGAQKRTSLVSRSVTRLTSPANESSTSQDAEGSDETNQSNGGRSNSGFKRSRSGASTTATSKGSEKLPSTLTQSIISNEFGLRPPSPPPKEPNRFKGKGKGKWGERKKTKMDIDDDSGAAELRKQANDEIDLEGDFSITEVAWKGYGPLLTSKATEADGSEGDTLWRETSDRHLQRFLKPSRRSQSPPTEEERVEVDLPDEMKKMLVIDSPSKPKQGVSEEVVVDGLLKGDSLVDRMRGAEVWGVGETEDGEGSDENDWDSEPEGWKGMVEM